MNSILKAVLDRFELRKRAQDATGPFADADGPSADANSPSPDGDGPSAEEQAHDSTDPFADGAGAVGRQRRRFALASVAAAVVAVAIGGLVFVHPGFDWRGHEAHIVQGRPILEAIGRVTSVEAGSVVLSPTLLGFNRRRFLLEPDTRVLVGEREGGVGDLRIGANVAIIYEARPDGLVARWLGLNLDRDAFRVNALRLDARPGSREPAPSASREPTPPGSREPAPPASQELAPPARGEPPPPARLEPAPSRARVERDPPPPAAAPRAPEATPDDRESDDPAAIIDWLLQGGGRK